ncbi:3-hexulose-6-phosphate synthase [Thalassobacillus sp. CUG 92003]|uniref:3-hexulose-6-phosphate synthase n=1 Tax=Thalassobacillus sp. CUG 92003 TaxID=2736641 RepID=UPI0015E72CED|nr:3-hexulose-6-phosphate synthase [Thalassobacillus sp. CUG 92003]
MNLQLALDRLSEAQCLQILDETAGDIDWIEVGTGVIKEYGMAIVREIDRTYPDHTLVADMKTCDAGKHEAKQAFEAGADITTVMAFASDQTILDTQEVAREYNARVMIDLLGVTDEKRIVELEALGVDLVSLHFGKDMQQRGGLDTAMFALVEGHNKLDVAVAGGIDLDSLPEVIRYQPDTLIVGSAITKQQNPGEAARRMKGVIRHDETNDNNRSQ